MLAGWRRAFIWVAIVALLANVHCLANCASEACNSTKSSSNSCHHKNAPDPGTPQCSHQPSEFTAPEADIAKVSVATTAAVIPALLSFTGSVLPEPVFLPHPDIGSPPSLYSFTTSILRI